MDAMPGLLPALNRVPLTPLSSPCTHFLCEMHGARDAPWFWDCWLVAQVPVLQLLLPSLEVRSHAEDGQKERRAGLELERKNDFFLLKH